MKRILASFAILLFLISTSDAKEPRNVQAWKTYRATVARQALKEQVRIRALDTLLRKQVDTTIDDIQAAEKGEITGETYKNGYVKNGDVYQFTSEATKTDLLKRLENHKLSQFATIMKLGDQMATVQKHVKAGTFPGYLEIDKMTTGSVGLIPRDWELTCLNKKGATEALLLVNKGEVDITMTIDFYPTAFMTVGKSVERPDGFFIVTAVKTTANAGKEIKTPVIQPIELEPHLAKRQTSP